MNKFVKILLGTLAGVIIVGTILKQSGVISKIHDDNEIDKMAEEKRSWESKAVGNAKFYLEIYDYTGNKELGDDFIGFRVKSKKDSSFSDDGDGHGAWGFQPDPAGAVKIIATRAKNVIPDGKS